MISLRFLIYLINQDFLLFLNGYEKGLNSKCVKISSSDSFFDGNSTAVGGQDDTSQSTSNNNYESLIAQDYHSHKFQN